LWRVSADLRLHCVATYPLNGGYLLDTNLLSELMREEPAPEVLHWFAAQTTNRLYTCNINQAETLAGIAVLLACIDSLEVINPWRAH
jgi:predicted nucleic acid-binding protein